MSISPFHGQRRPWASLLIDAAHPERGPGAFLVVLELDADEDLPVRHLGDGGAESVLDSAGDPGVLVLVRAVVLHAAHRDVAVAHEDEVGTR